MSFPIRPEDWIMATELPDMDQSLSDVFAAHVASFSWNAMNETARRATKTFLLDSIGVGLAGSRGVLAGELVATTKPWGQGSEATVWVTGERVSAQAAAIVNGYRIHCLEFDCLHEAAVVHPMATILSAAMAYAEHSSANGRPIDGATFGAALATGVDIAACLGAAAKGAIRFFRPATAGGFGAAAAIGLMAGHDIQTIRDLFGITFAQTSGTMQAHTEGSALLGLQIGFNARAVLCANDLVLAGFKGTKGAFDGRYGYFEIMENGLYDRSWIDTHLGQEFQIARLSHKPFPSGRLTHGIIDAIGRLEAHNIDPDTIRRIRCHVPPLAYKLVGRPCITELTANYAKLCLAFVGGLRLTRGDVRIADFAEEALNDPAVHTAASLIEVIEDGNPDQNAISPQHFDFTLADGRILTIDIPFIFGHPENPLTAEENEAKFRACASAAVKPLKAEHIERLIQMISSLEDIPDVAILPALTIA